MKATEATEATKATERRLLSCLCFRLLAFSYEDLPLLSAFSF
jgi:hypothetical protein